MLQRIFLQINFPPMRALEFIKGHVIFKLSYDQIYQMKTTNNCNCLRARKGQLNNLSFGFLANLE